MRGYDHLEVALPEGADPAFHNPHPFAELYPSLLGPQEAQQFVIDQGEVFCIRPACDGCALMGKGCEFVEEALPTSAIPHARRGVGFEERPFLILRFQPDHSFATLPKELWDNPWADKAYAHEANLFWAYTEPKRTQLHTLKGQLRFYGTQEEFAASPYAEYLQIFSTYEPAHHIVSLDYSAIEPRVSTLVSREPQWVEVFVGKPKPIFREVRFEDLGDKPLPKTVRFLNGRHFCFLKGEMDKEEYAGQCKKCPLSDSCTTVQDHLKNVPTDWHGINTEGLYGDEFAKNPDKHRKKELRGIGKIVGLALTYGGSAYTVANNMGTSKEDAQYKIDNFFRKLTVLKAYMDDAKATVRSTGKVVNLFGRLRDMSKWAFSQAPTDKERRKDAGYAERTALNHPIQSTAADILKVGKIRADEFIAKNGLSPFYEAGLVQKYEVLPSYLDLQVTMASSIHDEVMYLIRTDTFDKNIPPLYIAMQLNDVMVDQLRTGFSLELDCEYDQTRSWTAGTAFDTALIYLLRHVQGLGTTGAGSPSAGGTTNNSTEPNFALIEYSVITPEFLEKLAALCEENSALTEDTNEPLYELGVLHENTLYPHGSAFPQVLLDKLNVPYKLVNYHRVG